MERRADELPSIEGLDRDVKKQLIDYCQRNGLTQIRWVANHLLADLKAEEERRGLSAGNSHLSPLPAAVKPSGESPGPS